MDPGSGGGGVDEGGLEAEAAGAAGEGVGYPKPAANTPDATRATVIKLRFVMGSPRR